MNNVSENQNIPIEQTINDLFKILIQIFHTTYKVTWPNQEVFDSQKREWLKTFLVSDFNDRKLIAHGLNRCRMKDITYIPKPSTFISFCQPDLKDLNLPTHEEAYQEVMRHCHPSSINVKWSHPAVYHALNKTSRRRLFGAVGPVSIRESKKLFCSNYDLAIEMVRKGETLTELPTLLEEKVFEYEVTEKGSSILKSLKAGLSRKREVNDLERDFGI